jgi:hypothetical protein
MDAILRGYAVNEPTWFYLSFLLICAVFVRFQRLWSLRNLDLLALLLVSPGLLVVRHYPAAGYCWLFVTTGWLLVRMLCDPGVVRRPRLEPNMNAAGLAFLCGAAFLFLSTKVFTELPPASTVESVRRADELLTGQPQTLPPAPSLVESPPGPVPSLVAAPVVLASKGLAGSYPDGKAPEANANGAATSIETWASRTVALLSHLAVLSALVLIGARLYGDRDMGVAMGTLYMLLPCTAFDVQKVAHVLPAAFVLWAILCFRSPIKAGMFLGLASGTLFFPIFLLPLWALFYGGRGAVRFLASVVGTAGVLLAGLVPLSGGAPELLRRMLGYIEWRELQLRVVDSGPGFWSSFEPAYRIPVIVSFVLMLAVVSVLPRKKHLGHLIAYSAAITLGTQFWYTQQGGVYVLWYLPLVLLIVFRPGVHALEALEAKPLAAPSAATPPLGLQAVAYGRGLGRPVNTLFR